MIAVVGPPLAGVGGVVVALALALPDHEVVESGDLALRVPDAVLAVGSAVAPLARSDWDRIERAAAGTDLVVGVVTKVDAHRRWREVLRVNRALVAQWSPRRSIPWVAVAANPDLGDPQLDDLVALLRDRLTDPELTERNRKRCNDIRSSNRPVPATSRSVTDAAEFRTALQRVRLRLLGHVRQRCSEERTLLREQASAVRVGGAGPFEAAVRDEADAFLTDLDREVAREVAAAFAPADPSTGGATPPVIAGPPSTSRLLETRLMAVLGVGFGLGIALAASRLLSGLARGPSVLGLACGLTVGLAVVLWVVRVRGLLHDRALLDRWVTEVAATLRWHGEAMVAERLLAVESAWLQPRSSRTPEEPARAPGRPLEVRTDQYEW